MIRIALTGSIGMGKSTTAAMFADEGLPVWDADAAVHRLYGPDQKGTLAIAKIAPGAVTDDGVDRRCLQEMIDRDPHLLARIEAVIHPLVLEDRQRFLEKARQNGAPAALCDIPLLFETGAEHGFDIVVTVSAPAETQRERVMARPGMTEERFETVLARQLPDAEKRARADFIVNTGHGLEAARTKVREIVAELDIHKG